MSNSNTNRREQTRSLVSRIIGNLSSARPTPRASNAPDQTSTSDGHNVQTRSSSPPQSSQIASLNSKMQHAFPAIYGRRHSRLAPYNPRNAYMSRPVPPKKTLRRQVFVRNIVFLKKSEDVVPRGRKREIVFDEGRIAHLVAIDMSMTDVELYNLIEEKFSSFIDKTLPHPSGKVKVPNVDSDFKWTPEMVKMNCGQGDIYVQSLYPKEVQGGPADHTTSETQGQLAQDSLVCEELGMQNIPNPGAGGEAPQVVLPSLPCTVKESMDIDRLVDMFPHIAKSELYKLIVEQRMDLQEVIDALLAPTYTQGHVEPVLLIELPKPSSPTLAHEMAVTPSLDIPNGASAATILEKHSNKVMDADNDIFLTMTRACIWNKAWSFYKRALSNPSRLTKNLVIEFSGEEGVDAGSLRSEFFAITINKITESLFEGKETRKIPKKEWNAERDFEIAGMVFAHSILNGGPGMNCLSPTMYALILSGERDEFLEEYPVAADIPQNAATSDLLELIEKIDVATTNADIDKVLDHPEYMATVNASGWPPTKPINVFSKAQLLQGLIVEEVVHRRWSQLLAFRKGLKSLGVLQLAQMFPEQFREIFVYIDLNITYSVLSGLICSKCPSEGSVDARVYKWFDQYMKDREGEVPQGTPSLQTVLKFITGHSTLPPMGLKDPITIEYLPPTQKFIFPRAAACFSVLKLPTVHPTYTQFAQRMDEGIMMASNH